MEWTGQELQRLQDKVSKRYDEFRKENWNTDRKNLSELWNRHIKQVGITGIRPPPNQKSVGFKEILDVINFRNEEVSDALCILNPDRVQQFLLVPRETAEKILVVGMP